MTSYRYFLALLLPLSSTALAGGVADTVGISGLTYTPSAVTIQIGETIDFAASGTHPFRVDGEPSIACTTNCNVTYLRGGTYGFFCQNHQGVGMIGTVIVEPDDGWVFAGTFEHTVD